MPTDISDSLKQEILKAAGLLQLTGAEADYAVSRILDDHFCLDLGARLAARAFVAEAVRNMGYAQLENLRKRIQPAPKPRVHWGFGTTEGNDVEHFIFARVPSEEAFFTGTPEAARAWRFHGEMCPPEIVAQYAAAKNGRPLDPECVAEIHRLQRDQLEAATKRQNQSQQI